GGRYEPYRAATRGGRGPRLPARAARAARRGDSDRAAGRWIRANPHGLRSRADGERAIRREAVSPVQPGPAGGERDRAVAFMATNDRGVAGEVVALDGPGPAGWAVLDPDRPNVWDANYAWVHRARGADDAQVAE